jgi:hypothetical protein
MDAREQRGLVIAATCNIEKAQRGAYYVPSQSKAGTKYRVDPAKRSCDCPDFAELGITCKHIHAVRYVIQRERNADGSTTVTETLTVTETVETVRKRTTYPQNWRAYNAAQSVEKDRFQVLLADLCRGVPEPERTGRGRKPHSVRDSLFSMVFKVYSTFSSRRFSSDLREAHARGFLSRPVPGMKTVQFFENAAYFPILKELVRVSALPLGAVETTFAIDSSGFGSSRFETWFDHRYGKTTRRVVWVKCHVASGTRTNVVTAVRILEGQPHDSPQFIPLLQETAEGFTIGEVSADKAYGSYANFEEVAGCGGEPFIMFRSSATAEGGGTFGKMFHYFKFRQDEFLAHYHRRSNVESTFSMVKRKFGPEVRSKTDAAMQNEVLCKLVAHNLCVLIQEQHELGIEPVFWKDGTAEPKPLPA